MIAEGWPGEGVAKYWSRRSEATRSKREELVLCGGRKEGGSGDVKYPGTPPYSNKR